MSNIEYPLSSIDSTAFPSSFATAHLLRRPSPQPYDTTPLADAIQRVAEKWRLIAARVIQDESGKFHVQVPLGPLTEPVVKLTSASYDISLDWTPIANGATNICSRPPSKYFVHPSTPLQIQGYATKRHPLLSVHVSHLRDVTCIGFSLPHGVFDGFGRSLLLNAIGDELAGRDWTPPPLLKHNTLTEVFSNLPDGQDTLLEDYKREWPKTNLRVMLRTVVSVVYETFWHQAEAKTLYLSEKIVASLVNSVKKETSKRGEKVSTGDILVTWFIKAALADEEASSGALSLSSTISFRDVLAKKDPSLNKYPHNVFAMCPMPLVPIKQICSISLAAFALLHRSHVESMRTLAFAGAWAGYLGPVSPSPPTFPSRSIGISSFIASSKAHLGMTSFDLGGGTELIGFWEMPVNSILELDHIFFINKFKGGYIIMSAMRRARWKAVEKAAQKAERGEFS